jgi:hypothetical protein
LSPAASIFRSPISDAIVGVTVAVSVSAGGCDGVADLVGVAVGEIVSVAVDVLVTVGVGVLATVGI